MKSKWTNLAVVSLLLATTIASGRAQTNGWTLVGWNNLGMHCMDPDYSVFSLLPPYNTIHAQLIDPQGHFVINPAGFTVTYEAVADPSRSLNTTSAGKTNLWDHLLALFGVALPVDSGLAGNKMPGLANTPQPMSFDGTSGWFIAEGIPLTPYDDMRLKNPYPMMRLVARDQSGQVLATTDIVLPVSTEMSCLTCHASGSGPAAQPIGGWVNDSDPERDTRLNILRLHDDRQAGDSKFSTALAAAGYNAAGLYVTVTNDGKAILCAGCHASAALGTAGLAGTKPLTQAIHGHHATVIDPTSGVSLDASSNRSACYSCHPGSVTRCLRGAMGSAVAANGSLAIQCQSCHGTMSDLAVSTRSGWLNEPACQNCHSGTAVSNNGQIRYTSVFDAPGHVRQAVDQTFATNADTPAPGLSLYRFSTGHGGIKCEGCHGSTHAEFPSLHRNDNIQSIQHQGHVGMFAECTSCHGTSPVTVSGGPHGMHPVGQDWVSRHGGLFESGGATRSACQVCHGTDYRGTVLSRSQADRLVSTEDSGSKYLWRGFQVGCYTCHLGPNNGDANPNHPPTVQDTAASTTAGTPISVALTAQDSDHNALTLRVVSQPTNGSVALNGAVANYIPAAGFLGTETFTFAASDGSSDSNLGTASVTVGSGGTCPPISCGHGVANAVSTLIKAVDRCHTKLASAAYRGATFDQEACEKGDPVRSAKRKFDVMIAKHTVGCPAQVLTNANALRDGLLDGPQSLDALNGKIYCDASSGRLLEPGGEEEGFAPASWAALKCTDGIVSYLNKLADSVVTCQRRWADASTTSHPLDLLACETTAIGRAIAARDRVLHKGGCPACVDQTGQDNLRNTLVGQLSALRPLIFLCPASPL